MTEVHEATGSVGKIKQVFLLLSPSTIYKTKHQLLS
jgi:hypothetical protein